MSVIDRVSEYPAVSTDLMSASERRSLLLKDIEVVVDGGANCGQYARWLRECGYHKRIVSVEPAPMAFERLKEVSLEDCNWDVVNCALGSRPGVGHLRIASSVVGSSLFAGTSERQLAWPDDVIDDVVEVDIMSVDQLSRQYDIGGPIYLKLDIEGGELEALRGAEVTLSECMYVEVELPLVTMHEGAGSLNSIVGFLAERGFYPFAIEQNHSGNRETGQMYMVDGIFRRASRPE